jgi:hypothetical protein
MPLGFGSFGAGSASAGYGVPDQATVPNNALLPDANTGLPQTGRYIDPVAKSYKFTPDGRLYGMSTAQQVVQLALSQVRGSSCVPTDGQTFGTITEKNFDFQNRVRAAIGTALAQAVRNKQIAILSVQVYDVPSVPDGAIGSVRWQDLTTQQFDTTTIGP